MNKNLSRAVRFVDGHTDLIEGIGIPLTGPFAERDLYGTYWTPKTDLCLDWFGPGERPLLYAHGKDPSLRSARIGAAGVEYEMTDKGLWVLSQLDERAEYVDALRELIDRKALNYSSGTLDYLMDVDPRTGEMRSWPWIEQSLTPAPGNPGQDTQVRYAVRSVDAPRHFAISGLDLEAVSARGWLPEGTTPADLDEGDFAWVSDDGKTRKLPYKVHGKVNEAGWKAAWSRAHQDATEFAGGPDQAAVIKKLLADAPPGVSTKYDGPDGERLPGGRSAALRDAWSASTGASVLSQMLSLYACELDEPDQAALMKTAIDAWTTWIGLEAAEKPDADDDVTFASPYMSYRAGARNSAADQAHIDAIHDHAVSLGATAHADDVAPDSADAGFDTAEEPADARSEPRPGVLRIVRMPVRVDLAALRAEASTRSSAAQTAADEVVKTLIG